MMSNNDSFSAPQPNPSRLVVGFAGLLALLSASCCVLPIGLSIIGLGGMWLTMLGPFVAYRGMILVVVGLVLVWAWYRVWSRRGCAVRRRGTLTVMVFASLAFIAAASSPLWEDEAARTMFTLWRNTQ